MEFRLKVYVITACESIVDKMLYKLAAVCLIWLQNSKGEQTRIWLIGLWLCTKQTGRCEASVCTTINMLLVFFILIDLFRFSFRVFSVFSNNAFYSLEMCCILNELVVMAHLQNGENVLNGDIHSSPFLCQ